MNLAYRDIRHNLFRFLLTCLGLGLLLGVVLAMIGIYKGLVVDALTGSGRVVDGFIQLNLTDDPGRGGVRPSDLERFAERVLASDAIRLRGLMAVAPLGEPPRAAFARVRHSSELLARMAPTATDLSIGMSGDFAEAIAEGATHLRIGTAITGNRPDPG